MSKYKYDPAVHRLLDIWERRAADSSPADRMLMNKMIRELRDVVSGDAELLRMAKAVFGGVA
jgi:hypothetical protein